MAKIELLDGTIKEVKLPFYCKNGGIMTYKIFSKDHCVQVCSGSVTGVSVCHAGLALFDQGVIEITPAEYSQVIYRVTQKLLAK